MSETASKGFNLRVAEGDLPIRFKQPVNPEKLRPLPAFYKKWLKF